MNRAVAAPEVGTPRPSIRRKGPRTSLCLLLAALSLAAPAAAAPYYDSALRYSFELPERWFDIPRHILDRLSTTAAQTAGQGVEKVVAGFQDIKRPWLTYPYAVIQHHPNEGQSLLELASGLEQLVKEPQPLPENAVVAHARFEHPTIDPARGAVLQAVTLEAPNGVKVRGISALFPGKEGVAQIGFYSTESNFDQDWALFEPSVQSFRYDAGYGYEDGQGWPATIRRWIVRRGPKILGAAALGGLTGFLLNLARSRRKPPPPPPGNTTLPNRYAPPGPSGRADRS